MANILQTHAPTGTGRVHHCCYRTVLLQKRCQYWNANVDFKRMRVCSPSSRDLVGVPPTPVIQREVFSMVARHHNVRGVGAVLIGEGSSTGKMAEHGRCNRVGRARGKVVNLCWAYILSTVGLTHRLFRNFEIQQEVSYLLYRVRNKQTPRQHPRR